MQPDEDLCLCFHVTRRKVENYLRIERPAAPSLLSECGGAGTGCGWCRPFLKRLFEAARKNEADAPLPSSDQYAASRGSYIQAGKGKPPVA
ncbi:BFD-like [2Fe-2S] binding domain protein [Pirellulimonas nuda]|uniref:BFD-like [2Fe-2S] binding domain protein n=1 Tax=Pirellulimonas nuda TaxID=2528009 RepID=A0A518DH77_9BACT|nr:(2Fe-2S)-binding protein [Pirellulimonas nuda]QDU90827.1 BFD-like [2Fe-2S] binding domain protein [Pirellulimonas nuda]